MPRCPQLAKINPTFRTRHLSHHTRDDPWNVTFYTIQKVSTNFAHLESRWAGEEHMPLDLMAKKSKYERGEKPPTMIICLRIYSVSIVGDVLSRHWTNLRRLVPSFENLNSNFEKKITYRAKANRMKTVKNSSAPSLKHRYALVTNRDKRMEQHDLD